MSLLFAALLGIVQGLTEFLPVSSSGHLVMAEAMLGIDPPGVAFEVLLHLATLCAVVWAYRARVGELAAGLVRVDREAWRYTGLILLASVPAGVVGVLGRSELEAAFGQPVLAAAMLLVTGCVVFTLKFTGPRASDPTPDVPRSLWIGIAQAFAILPGISRSGSTVAVGAWRGLEVEKLAEFSFLLSIPAILGASLLQLGDMRDAAAIGAGPLAVGFVFALAAGVLAIRLFVRMLRNRTFHHFAWYCWAAGTAYLLAAAFVPALR
ncbi:MAG: undecaprenyl-diphosphate phosphatase [Gemmatimonadota bacterium]